MMDATTLTTKKLRFRNVRSELLLTQEQLADVAKISLKVVWNAEHQVAIRATSAYAILKIFNGLRRDLDLPVLDIDDLDWKISGD